MKLVLFVTLMFLSRLGGFSQSINDTIVNLKFSLEDTISQKLADLAVIKNPQARIFDNRSDADLHEWKRTRLAFLSLANATFNMNEGNLRSQKDSLTPLLFYPRYNFSVSIPLSVLFTRPQEVKRAKSVYNASLATRESEINNLKSAVKRAYQNYKANKLLLTLQESILQDEVILFSQTQDKFEKNQVTLEIFTNASKRYNAELVKKLNLVRDYGLARIDLELLIGMDLIEALALVTNAQPAVSSTSTPITR